MNQAIITNVTSLAELERETALNPEQPAMVMDDGVIEQIIREREDWIVEASERCYQKSKSKKNQAFFTIRRWSDNRLALYSRFRGFDGDENNGWILVISPDMPDKNVSARWLTSYINDNLANTSSSLTYEEFELE
jgi:hypothetical protein